MARNSVEFRSKNSSNFLCAGWLDAHFQKKKREAEPSKKKKQEDKARDMNSSNKSGGRRAKDENEENRQFCDEMGRERP